MNRLRLVLLVVALAAIVDPAGAFSAEGDVVRVGKALSWRENPGLVLLKTGDVLAVGGDQDDTAELILEKVFTEPAPDGFRLSQSLWQGPPLLQSGFVLIPGYYDYRSSTPAPVTRPMLYGPQGNSWAPTSPAVEEKISERTLVALHDGRVLGVGGCGYEKEDPDSIVCGTKTAEIYDPLSDEWTPTGPMLVGRVGLCAVLLPSKKVLVFGGTEESGKYVDSTATELYDPTTGAWSRTGDMVKPRYSVHGVVLPNGKVVAISGRYLLSGMVGREVPNVEIYDPETETWTEMLTYAAGPYEDFWFLPSVPVLLPSGKVLFMYRPGYGILYDPEENVLTEVINGIVNEQCGPIGFSSVLLPNGNVLMVGGYVAYDYACEYWKCSPPCLDFKDIFEYEGGTPSWCSVPTGYGTYTIMNEGLSCDDGDPNTTDDHCDGKGNCVAGPWDAGVDAGADAETTDTEMLDTGWLDAGEDGGTDVGIDTGADAGADAWLEDGPDRDDARTSRNGSSSDASVEVVVYAPGCGCAQVGM